ncbi:MAG: hypothetical protein WBW34_01840 [Nitrososphaeraceae archaeon]
MVCEKEQALRVVYQRLDKLGLLRFVAYHSDGGRLRFPKAEATPDGLRLAFKTHDVAESYAQFYRDSYNGQYKSCVIGVKD